MVELLNTFSMNTPVWHCIDPALSSSRDKLFPIPFATFHKLFLLVIPVGPLGLLLTIWCHIYLDPDMLAPGFEVVKKIIGKGGCNTRKICLDPGEIRAFKVSPCIPLFDGETCDSQKRGGLRSCKAEGTA